MHLRRILLPAFTILLSVSLSLEAAPSAPVTLDSVVRKVSAQQKATRTLTADFKQEKAHGLLAKTEVSAGTFLFSAPNKVLWVYDQPRPVTMLIADGWLTTYYPTLAKAEKMEVKRFEDRIFKYLGAAGAIDELGKYFNFRFVDPKNESFYRFELQPKTKALARQVRQIRIWIDKKTYLTSQFEYVEGNGNSTRYEFSNIKVNAPVPASRFVLNLPATVKVEQMKLN
ncbi:MAG TPA: outer membrane lipoprotein carrier protein LolA [Thermoanaerobaculia bacterium]|nr:outer membrane lipoprotein carrier protein LolA [Thermoanaerobaculia bacterium]